MTTNFSQSMPKIILLVLSTIAIGNAAIFVAATQANAEDIKTGPIFSNKDAKKKCPLVAKKVNRKWNGQWTTINSKQSVCGMTKK